MPRRLVTLALALVALGIAGCDPSPSTKLAPDAKMPDVNKMSAAEMRGGAGMGVPKEGK